MQKAFSGQTLCTQQKRLCTENILWTSTPDPHQTCLSHHLRILVNVFRDICFVLTNLYNIIWHHKCYERINQNIFLVNVGFTIDPLSLCETSFHIFQTLSQLSFLTCILRLPKREEPNPQCLQMSPSVWSSSLLDICQSQQGLKPRFILGPISN